MIVHEIGVEEKHADGFDTIEEEYGHHQQRVDDA